MTKLKSLRLNGNRLESLLGIDFSTSLKRLDLSNNSLQSLPLTLAKLQHLTELNIENNALTEIPPQISLLAQLKKLHIGVQRARLRFHRASYIGMLVLR